MTAQVNSEFWRGKKVFLTGHTGFKGSWAALWLQSMGARVKGYALAAPTNPSLYDQAQVAQGMQSDIGDIRDAAKLAQSMTSFNPDILIHMAAQPLVRLSYRDPVETYSTNVMGTVHVFEAARQCGNLRAIVNITTDKCYENREWEWGYRENEPMGGHDPYSNSKGCAELVTSAYQRSFFHLPNSANLASVRAGNVIGGGDWAEDRLIPDILRAFEKQQPVVIRNPLATRPWQHVLEPLAGYFILVEKLYQADGKCFAEGWNFGPREEDAKPVQWIVEELVRDWGNGASWQLDQTENPHEANFLKLDISKVAHRLKWHPRWNLATALEKIVHWHQQWLAGQSAQQLCLEQIQQYAQTTRKI
ncbi:CDP-glucose 4,6-dehydratase [Limnobacter litoralis]|uniref:CDP-glucose 4,6-dehydratase n=1 Tax=Limnobacter litoralis TaxID=481366 RepID=A0ABQ5YUN7_9BURK|nr:CDP-glucose 4,6-dehydratase [Limnobacter litoralis]GLR27762.1 CDP-glucose 4,6-dehydratase [Limnobacter litoralis]